MDIVRNPDGTLVVPVSEDRHHDDRDDADTVDDGADAPAAPTTRVLHPGEGGYDEALAEWDIQQMYRMFTGLSWERTETTTRNRERRNSDWLITAAK